jgi:O-antigen/teichoic acid export membrane protein
VNPVRTARRRAAGGTVAPPGSWLGQVSVVAVHQVALFGSLGLFAIVTARVLGPANRGVLVIFVTLSSLLMLVGSLGTNTAARVRLVGPPERRLALADYLGLSAALLLAQAVVAAVLGVLVLGATGGPAGGYVLAAFALYSVLNLACTFLRDGLYAYGHTGSASRADAVGAAIQLLTAAVLFAVWHGRLVLALVAVLAGAAAELGYLAQRYRAHSLSLLPRLRPGAWRADIGAGLPAVLAHLGQAMTVRFDRILLGVLASTTAVGVYSVAATLTETLWLVPGAIAQVAFHRVASGRTPVRRLRRIRLANLGLAVLGGILLALAAPVLVRLLFGQTFRDAVPATRVLLIAAVAIACYQVDITCVLASNGLRAASVVTSTGFAAVLLGDLALIPRFGMMGAAWASVAGYGLMAVLAQRTLARLGRHARGPVRR